MSSPLDELLLVKSDSGLRRIALPIVLPCHRVLAAGGALGGYSGELWRKSFLLELERSA